ncbi:Zn-dependent protease with chaperone function [Marinospirillum celere]|uniref:Zn-dependent protease with chaperone function n=1 Tax=Marinospirillum celere TaxID=1122252 RepID=A0A1I1FSS6_9GAMM|nr:M48 family metallopeptidase [Marinospirillum celere]SFC02341.1 Zn-dependent protease with chaperone function [Marinospirillum celere]
MNFFEHQDRARKRTGLLIGLFLVAVLALISITSLVLLIFLNEGKIPWLTSEPQAGDWKILASVSLSVLLLVLLSSFFKQLQLNAGGEVVAEALGGRRLPPDTRDPEERRLLNLVEEMALASGSPVPPVYLLEDKAINAFAAGYSPQDAVIGITRGAVQQLNRDELQGVIAHEFSHIFNGDMRLNLRLVALLHGILIIGLGGRVLLHSMSAARFRRTSRDGRATAVIVILGILLLVVGYIGIFFGKLIKAAVSRQREFLADASAVQFTRNPQGIAGALDKIRRSSQQSKLESGHSEEFSHLFFSNALGSSISGLLATHPPLDERIQRLNAGPLPKTSAASPQPKQQQEAEASPKEQLARPLAFAAAAQASIEAMGQPQQCHLDQARRTLEQLDSRLLEATHEPWTARAVIYALLLSRDPEIREQQLAALNQEAAPETLHALKELQEFLPTLTDEQRLPLAELSLPALKYLTPDQKDRFYRCMTLLIRADQRLSLFEWSLSRLIRHSLDDRKERQDRKLPQLLKPLAELLSLVIWVGQQDSSLAHLSPAEKELAAQASFAAASRELQAPDLQLLARDQVSLKRLDELLAQINQLRPVHKPQVLKALASAISGDGRITLAQAELFRVLGVTLDCPLPPLQLGEDL